MRDRLNSKKTADEIGRHLLRTARISEAELGGIASSEHLFTSVLERIQIDAAADNVIVDPRPRFAFLSAAAATALITVAAIASSLLYSSRQAPAVSVHEPVFTREMPELSGAAFVSIGLSSAEHDTDTKTATKKATRNLLRTSQRAVKPQVLPPEMIPQFYAIGEISDPAEVARGGRIVRVGIPRASLFAMGVALPLENENAVVAAELLVGQDGVTRAIRLVE